MKIAAALAAVAALCAAGAAAADSFGNCTGNVLVAMSSASAVRLTNGKNATIGFYLDEMMIPVMSLLDRGFAVTIANPRGNTPPMDPRSNSSRYFDPINPENAERRYQAALAALYALGDTFTSPAQYADLGEADLAKFDAVYIPGGHAPLVDLWDSADLGRVLEHFIAAGKPITAMCHGPVALLSTLASSPNATWAFAGRNLTVFSTAAEKRNEARWGGNLPWYPVDRLSHAGAHVTVRGPVPYLPNVVRDVAPGRFPLATGQNPASADDVAALLGDSLSVACSGADAARTVL